MIRILIEILVPLLLPVAIYAAWMAVERRRADKLGRGEKPTWSEAPLVWLSVAGLALAAVATVGLVLIRDADGPRGVYVAPRMDPQGNIVLGRVEPAAK